MTESIFKKIRVPAMLVFVLGALFAIAPAARAEEDPVVAVERLFRESVDLYSQGKYAQAQQKLKEVQDKDPRHELVARLVDEAGTRIIVKMMADVRMGAEPTRIWEQYRKYNLGKLVDARRIQGMTDRLVSKETSEDERSLLYQEFAQLAQYAVPFLAPHLKNATDIGARSQARLAIAHMGQRATLSLLALLDHKDQLMRENVILTLGDILPSDARAIPALKARIEDPKESDVTKSYAKRILRRITGLEEASWKPAAQYYYDAANRYYLDRAGVAEEAEEGSGMVWHLNEAGDLMGLPYPLWAWNEQMAEESILHGLALNPEIPEFFALAASNYASQWSEVKDLMDISNEQPPRHHFSAEEKKELSDWDAKLVDARRNIAAVGKEYVNAALNKVHADLKKFPGHIRLPGIAATLAKELQFLDPKGDLLSGNSALAAGLDSSEYSVQYACANALATVNRFPATWAGSEKVGAILGRGISENKALQILLVEENDNLANEMAQRMKNLAYGVSVVSSGRAAMTAARAFPPKDVIIIAENLKRDLNTYQLLEELRADLATRYLPAGILHAQADREIMQSRYGTSIALVERESNGNDLKTPIDKIADQRIETSANKRKAHETSVTCANTLNHIDVNATFIKLDDAVPHAVNAMIGRKDDIRNPCAMFLGKVGGGSMKDAAAEALKRVFEDPDLAKRAAEDLQKGADALKKATEGAEPQLPGDENPAHRVAALKRFFQDNNGPVALRRNVIRALGRVKPEGLEELYAKAQTDPDQVIKDYAAESLGQKSRTGKTIADFLNANRIDKDKKEK